MNSAITSITQPLSCIRVTTVPHLHHHQHIKLGNLQNLFGRTKFLYTSSKCRTILCANTSPWEPAPITYAPENDGKLLKQRESIFETTISSSEPTEPSTTTTEQKQDVRKQPFIQLQYFRWPLWLLGPSLLLATGLVPTLWLPVSSVFLGPNIASLLSLTGLDCIFNLGASLFLLMADSSARPINSTQDCNSRPPVTYQFWNMIANVVGFVVPLAMLFSSQKGFLQPQLPFISFAVLLGPYFLLLAVQMLMEMLTWHWQSPVWLVTPVVYEAYRLLQLMRGLNLGPELGAPSWMMHTLRALVCCWVLVLGVQLMRVAWYAGFTVRAYLQQSTASADAVDGNGYD